ncbi:MAG: DNA polymerase IV, partial [Schaalia hyovaginalis]|nr:DNA polymerase IV [Schaalia hyovaginalis]
DVGREVFAAARALFSREPMPQGGVRLCGVRCEGLQSREAGVAVRLDDDARPLASERAMDSVRSRFGEAALRPATLLEAPDARRRDR